MKSIFISLSSILILVYFGFGLLLYLRQNSFIYYPTPEQSHDGVESRSFSINGETINTFIVNPGQKKAVLYFGGNSEEVGFNAPIFGPALPDSTIYLTNYRGYGGSSGEPSEQVLFADALTLYDELKAQYSSLSIIGRSLGSGVAAQGWVYRFPISLWPKIIMGLWMLNQKQARVPALSLGYPYLILLYKVGYLMSTLRWSCPNSVDRLKM